LFLLINQYLHTISTNNDVKILLHSHDNHYAVCDTVSAAVPHICHYSKILAGRHNRGWIDVLIKCNIWSTTKMHKQIILHCSSITKHIQHSIVEQTTESIAWTRNTTKCNYSTIWSLEWGSFTPSSPFSCVHIGPSTHWALHSPVNVCNCSQNGRMEFLRTVYLRLGRHITAVLDYHS